MNPPKFQRFVGSYFELDFFAGAPNPRWQVAPTELERIRKQVEALPAREVHHEALDKWEPVSGYGGVLLHVYSSETTEPTTFRIYNGLIVDGTTGLVRDDPGRRLEQELVSAIPREQAALIDYQSFTLLAAPLNEIEAIDGVDSGAAPNCSGALAYPPLLIWRQDPGKSNNHCYNYANDVFGTLAAVPGGQLLYDMTELELHQQLVADGLVPVSTTPKVLPVACHQDPNAHLVAACQRLKNPAAQNKMENGVLVPTYRDFHFLRFDATGLWSHKDGVKLQRNTDNKGKALTDLSAAKFKYKHYWVGYYWTYPGLHRKIRPPGP